jgi:hypothetical protein
MAAIINRALADLEKDRAAIRADDHVRDEAMAWINSPDCKTYCLVLDLDYKAIQERGAALYRRFLERDESREKARGRPRKPFILPLRRKPRSGTDK